MTNHSEFFTMFSNYYRPDPDGLSCGHCVKRVKESPGTTSDVELADVTVTEAHVTGVPPVRTR